MAFDRRNLVSIAERSPMVNNADEGKITKAEFEAHTKTDPIHVSIQDRKRWDEIERRCIDYINYLFISIIGKFDFGEIGISNNKTLADIILQSNKERIQDVQSERAERNSLIAIERETYTRFITNETNARISTIELLNQQMKDLDNKIEKEITDRIEAISLEANERTSADTQLQANIDAVDLKILEEANRADGIVEAEALARLQQDTILQENINTLTANHEKLISDMNYKVETFIATQGINIESMQNSINDFNEDLRQEIQDRIEAVNNEASARIQADSALSARIDNLST